MLRRLLLNGLITLVAAYWGDIPSSRELVEISVVNKNTQSLELTVHSSSQGRLVLDLTLNSDVISDSLRSYIVTDNVRERYKPHSPCHYRGSLSGVVGSTAMLSSCSGIYRGSITTSQDTWYLTSQNERYVLFRDSELPNIPEQMSAEYNGVEISTPQSADNVVNQLKRFKRADAPSAPPLKTLEIVVVTDRALWLQFNSNVSEVEEFALATVNYIDEVYRHYNIRLALVGMDNWRTTDLISVTPQYAMTLRNFTLYRQEKLLNLYRGHDVSILMTGVDFEGPIIGYAGIGTMCRSSSSNVNYNSRSNPLFYGTVISHELGHNFGMYHDSDECSCVPEGVSCIMSTSLGSPVSTFSDCSKEVLDTFEGTCLDNIPKSLYGDPVCGNGFVEKGEECDCGTYKECLANDPCCEPTGCKLKIESECYTGACCKDCKFTSYKKKCRVRSSECDLEEFCTGTDAQCPVNRFTQDGSVCAEGGGFCNYGMCQTRDSQCVSLWGEGARATVNNCYSLYNKKGEWYGNCGSLDRNKYIGCVGNDVMCGKLFCVVDWMTKAQLPGLIKTTLPMNATYNCTLAYPRRAAENKDVAMVYDGSMCGESQWCKSGQCINFEKPPCPTPNGVECGGYGRCNDLNQCHCDAGYDPQFNCAIRKEVAGWDIKSILIAVMIIILVVLPISITGLLVLRKYNMRCHKFIDQHTQIRFSVRLPSISRTASTLHRQRQQRQKPPPRPSQPPSSSSEPPSYHKHSSWYNSNRPGTSAPPSRPLSAVLRHSTVIPPSPASTPPKRPASTYYSPPYDHQLSGHQAQDNSYTALHKNGADVPALTAGIKPSRPAPATTPYRPAPPVPSVPTESSPAPGIFSPPYNKRGPKGLRAASRESIKLDISGPEAARNLLDDKPLNQRMLAGSRLTEIQR